MLTKYIWPLTCSNPDVCVSIAIERLDIEDDDGSEEAKMIQGELSANLRLRVNTYMPIMHTAADRNCVLHMHHPHRVQ